MRHVAAHFAAVVALAAVQQTVGLCLSDNSSGFPLPTVVNSAGVEICPAGFHCPGFNPMDNATFPVYCVPTPECQVTRMQGDLCDESMGTYEPIICPSGSYCPNATAIVDCPEGYFCRVGQFVPTKCAPLSICAEGSKGPTTLTGVVVLVVLFAAVLVLRYVYFAYLQPHPEWTSYFAVPSVVTTSPTSAAPTDDLTAQTRTVLAASFARARDIDKPIKIKFSNLSVSLRDSGRTLVAAVSGSLNPGTVTAILGPSGSGKTLLLKALLGQTDANWAVGGLLTVNGDAHVGKYRSTIGSVPQDDVLHTELTVYRNVLYNAQLRLPQHWSDAQRGDFIRAVLESVGLAHVADVPIGDAENRGVSGGQRKRASIAVELVTGPQALLLDEPTKGLDSNTALELVSTLRRVALETDLTVGMAVNQPRTEIWNALDELLILAAGGRTVYQGKRSNVAAYMEQRFGLKFSPESNPADVVLDAVSARGDEMADAWTAHHVDPISSAASDDRAFLDAQNEISWNGASFLSQVRIAHVRYIEKQLTLLSSLFVEMGVALILGVILGFSQIDNEVVGYFVYPFARISSIPLTQMTAQMHMYAFMSLGLATGTAGVNVFVNDKSTYSRAVASGSSRIAHYIGSVTASWYRLVVVTLAFTAPYHLMSKSSAPYGQYFALFFVFSWVMYAIAGIIALLAEQRTAALISGVVAILFACFSGSIKFPTGIKKISFCFWAAQVLQQWVYQDTTNVYEETSTQYGWALNDKSTTFGVMIAMGVVYHMIGCILLISHGKA